MKLDVLVPVRQRELVRHGWVKLLSRAMTVYPFLPMSLKGYNDYFIFLANYRTIT